MKKDIEKWLSENEKIPFMELSQNEEFINLLLSLISVNRQKVISEVHKCAIAITNKDKGSFSGCIAIRLNNPQADT